MAYRMVYYRGAAENDWTDGRIVMRKSTDGRVWDAEETIYTEVPTYCTKGPNITKLSDGRLLLVYNRVSNPAAREGFFAMFSSDDGDTWGDATEISVSYSDAAEGGPVIELANGNLLAPCYGTAGGAYDAACIFSTDNGVTWGSETLIGDGSGDGLNYVEPNIVELSTNNLLCLMREVDTDSIYQSSSADNGASWGAPASAFGGTGAPRLRLLSNGDVICVYRSDTGALPAYRTTDDGGSNWSAEQFLQIDDMYAQTYGSAVEISGESAVGVAYGCLWNRGATTDEGTIHYSVIDFGDLP